MIVGTKRQRIDARSKALGSAAYTADIALDGALAAALWRSPHAFARIRGIDVTKAAAMPGVRAIAYSGNTPAKPLDFGIKDAHLFPTDFARYAGEPLAAVAADTLEQAHAAVAAIAVDLEPLTPVLDARAALEPGATLVHPMWKTYERAADRVLHDNVCGHNRIRTGDVDGALAAAAKTVSSHFTFSAGMPGYLEPRAAVARREPDGGLTVWCGSQSPYSNRDDLADFFDLDKSKVRFVNQFVGGAFGGKILMAAEWYAAALALQCDRPVRLVWTRHEDGLHIYPRHGGYADFTTGVADDGTLLAMRASFVFDTGAYIGFGTGTALIATMLATAPYRVPNVDLEATLVYTNKHNAGPVRAPGAPQANWAKESHLDEVARALGMDPLAFRLHNVWRDGDKTPAGQTLDHVAAREVLERAADAIGWHAPRERGRGRGLCLTWWFSACGRSEAKVEVLDNGRVRIASGNPEVGTGSAAGALPLIAAEVLGIEPDSVDVVLGDTATATYDGGVGGSSSTFSAGVAVEAAARDARDKLIAAAEDALEARADDIELVDGTARVRGTSTSVPLAELARRAGGAVSGAGQASEIDDPEFDAETTQSHGFAAWLAPSYAATAADVSVDEDTGRVTVHELVTAQDVGFAINPAGCIGQIEGGAVQGLGWALTEELQYDEDGGVHPGFKEYLLPTAVDAPNVRAILVESRSGAGPRGMKGVGEPPVTTPPGAIANAIRDAVGVAPHEAPMTPERVWRALRGTNIGDGP